MAEPQPFSVAPLEAIAFLRDKLDVPTRAWTDLWQDMHARAFVVAGAQSDALVADFHDAVNRAVSEGRTLEQFKAEDFDRIVSKHGWSYKGSRGWRSRVIFETNLRMAYAAGRWAQIQRLKKQRPYLRYVHADPMLEGKHSRPEHAAWHNTVLPVDHPWWLTHYTPNGWGCRCYVQSLSERDLKRYGLNVSLEAPTIEMVARTINTPDGPKTIWVPQGIDPGFAYNVGIAGFGRGAESLAAEKHGKWEPLRAPQPTQVADAIPLDRAKAQTADAVTPGDETGIRKLLANALGGDELIVADPTGAFVALSQAIADHWLESRSRQDGRERFFPLLPELVADPAEIWAGFAASAVSGRAALRRRYIKLVQVDKQRIIGLVADADGRRWSGLTFFRGDKTTLKGLREGLRIYRRP